jgi:hypothetical protein
LAGRLLWRPTGQGRRHRVEEGDAAAHVGDDDGVADTVEGDVQLLPLAAFLPPRPLLLPGTGLGGPPGGFLLEEPSGIVLGLLAVRHVAGDLEEAPDPAGVVP